MFKVLYNCKGELILQVWWTSNEYPDRVFNYSDFEKETLYNDNRRIFQWLIECASKFENPYTCLALVHFALDKYAY